MRVTHVITGLETGGAETMLHRLVQGWGGTGLESDVISLRDRGTLGSKLESAGATVRSIGMRGAVPSPWAALRLRAAVAASRPQLVQGWMYHGNVAAMAGAWAIGGGVPVIWNIRHSVYDLRYEKGSTALMIRLGARLSGSPARIIYNSRTSATQHAALGFATGGAVVIPNGFDTTRFRPDADARRRWRRQLGVPADLIVVGLVGRWHPMKDHGTFMRAAARVRAVVPGARFALAGRGADDKNPEFKSLVRALELGDVVTGCGEVEDVPGFLAGLDVAVCSSYSEAFPNVVGEAMACGLPVVTTDVGDAAWIVGEAGKVVRARDPEAMAAAILALLACTPDERLALGARGRERVRAAFAIDQIASRYRELYEEVLDEPQWRRRGR